MKNWMLLILISAVGAIMNWLSLQVGWWWMTPLPALLVGLLLRRSEVSFLVSLCIGGVGWGLPLVLLAMNAPIMSVANVVESVIGLSATCGVLIVFLTVLLGCSLSVIGTWVGVALRKAVPALKFGY